MSLSPKQTTTTPFSVTDILSPLDEPYNHATVSVEEGTISSRRELHESYASAGMDSGHSVAASTGILVPSLGSALGSGSASPPMAGLYRQPMTMGTPPHHGVHHHHQQIPSTVSYQGMPTAAVAAGMNTSYNLHAMAPAPQPAFHSVPGTGPSSGYCNGADLQPYNNVQTGWYGTPGNPDPRFGTVSSKIFYVDCKFLNLATNKRLHLVIR